MAAQRMSLKNVLAPRAVVGVVIFVVGAFLLVRSSQLGAGDRPTVSTVSLRPEGKSLPPWAGALVVAIGAAILLSGSRPKSVPVHAAPIVGGGRRESPSQAHPTRPSLAESTHQARDQPRR